MGQYYKCVNLDKKEYAEPWDFDNGAKLMEHSWVGNKYVAFVMNRLNEDWAGDRISWEGDYADEMHWTEIEKEELVTPEQFEKLVREYMHNNSNLNLDTLHDDLSFNLYNLAYSFKKVIPDTSIPNDNVIFIYNMDKKLYVNITKGKNSEENWNKGWMIHPLPLLTCNGNGRGGGDYRMNPELTGRGNYELVGSWSKDHIFTGSVLIPGYDELIFDLIE